MSDLSELARKFPDSLVKTKPGAFKAAYVEHAVIVQRLLEVCGPFNFTVDQLITEPDGKVSGCFATLECWVDGDYITITEVGDVENIGSGGNGAAGKVAASDALKRCAMRLGLGLHLWAQDNWYLEAALKKREDAAKAAADE